MQAMLVAKSVCHWKGLTHHKVLKTSLHREKSAKIVESPSLMNMTKEEDEDWGYKVSSGISVVKSVELKKLW